MIGTELLQLLQGDPLAQMRQQMGGPNPNPQAPPPRPAAPTPLAESASTNSNVRLRYGWRPCPRNCPTRLPAPMPPDVSPNGSRPRAPGSPASARRPRAASTAPAAVWTPVRGLPEPARPGSIVQSA